MTAPRNVPLIERRADARVLEEQIREHRRECRRAPSACAELTEMQAELKAIRQELKTWFGPGPDQEKLFD